MSNKKDWPKGKKQKLPHISQQLYGGMHVSLIFYFGIYVWAGEGCQQLLREAQIMCFVCFAFSCIQSIQIWDIPTSLWNCPPDHVKDKKHIFPLRPKGSRSNIWYGKGGSLSCAMAYHSKLGIRLIVNLCCLRLVYSPKTVKTTRIFLQKVFRTRGPHTHSPPPEMTLQPGRPFLSCTHVRFFF